MFWIIHLQYQMKIFKNNTLQSVLLLLLLISIINSKTAKKILKLSNFHKEGPFIFLMKFHLGPGISQMQIAYTKNANIPSQSFYSDISVGMVNETMYPQFSRTLACSQKKQYLFKIDRLNFRQETKGIKTIRIFDLNEQQMWYFYLFSCNSNVEQLVGSVQEIDISFNVLNDNSHFGLNQKLLYIYVAAFIVWGLLLVKYAFPLVALLNFKHPDKLKFSICGGLILLGIAYLYRLANLILYSFDGYGIHIFQILYLILKNVGEVIITTMLVFISWGWSIIHLNVNKYYIIVCVLACAINIVSLVLSSLIEEHEDLYHHYETIPGLIVLVLKFIIFFIFFLGILKSLQQSSSKIVHFIKKLGIIGGLYLLSWPMTVIIVELTLPNYIHRELITFIEQLIHLSACTMVCNMISNPESAYRKISLQEDDNPLKMKKYRNN